MIIRQIVKQLVDSNAPQVTLERAFIAIYNALLIERDAIASGDKTSEKRVKALADAIGLLIRNPDRWSSNRLYLAGASLKAVGEIDRAIEVFDTLVKLYADKPEAAEDINRGRILRTGCLLDARQWQKAHDAINELLEVKGNEDSPTLHRGLAQALTELGKYDEALKSWRTVAGMFRQGVPVWWEARLGLVETLIRAKRRQEAAAKLSLMTDLHGEPPNDELKVRFKELSEKTRLKQ